MIRLDSKCKTCKRVFRSLAECIAHASVRCDPPARESRRGAARHFERVYSTSGHRSWIDARTGRFTRDQRIRIYARNFAEAEGKPMPNLSDGGVLHGRTRLQQGHAVSLILAERTLRLWGAMR